jgi:hypothetical protein
MKKQLRFVLIVWASRLLFEATFWVLSPLVWGYFLVADIAAWRRPWPWGKLMMVRQDVKIKFKF